jgi:glycosyltransferase involved in cell wall biosynthesis
MSAPAFSVIVPAYNAARTLPDTLASIAAQTFRDYEVVVVNDGSTDETDDVAERLARGRAWRVVHQANRGLPGARNAGVAVARGHRVAFLDSDDMWLPGYLARMQALLERAPDVGLAYCDAYIYDERRRRIARRSMMQRYRPATPPEEPRAFFLALLRANFVWSAACAPRSVIEEVGGFDESVGGADDWNMWLRVSASGWRAVGTPELLGIYRHRAGQMHRDEARMLRAQRDALQRVLDCAPLDDELRAANVGALAEAQRRLAAGRFVPRWRRARAALLDPTRGIKDFRFRPPEEVVTAFPQLFGR